MISTEGIQIEKEIVEFEQLPIEMLFEIARKLSGPDALQFSKTSKYFQKILNDADLWGYYLKRDFPEAKLFPPQVHLRAIYEKEFVKSLKDIANLIVSILKMSGSNKFSNTEILKEINSKISAITKYTTMRELTILRDEARAAIRAENIIDQTGDTPLMAATKRGDKRNVQTLIAAGVNVNATHRTHLYTALHQAAQEGRTDIVTVLVTAGANVEVVGRYSNTPLHSAEHRCHWEIVAILNQVINTKKAFQPVIPLLSLEPHERTPHLSPAANRLAVMPWLRDMADELLLELAKEKSVADAMKLSKVSPRFREILNDPCLWTHYLERDFPAIPLPIKNGHPRKAYEEYKQLKDDIKKLSDVIAFIRQSRIFGQFWVEDHTFNNIETLVNIQSSISLINANTTIAQLSALKNEATAAIRADNILSKYGNTPLIMAAKYDKKDIAQSLIAAGAKVNAASNEGHTALMLAAFLGHKDIVQILLRARANVTMVNRQGKSAISMAENQIIIIHPKHTLSILKQDSAFKETKVLLLLSKPVRTLLQQNPILAKSCFR